MLRMQLSGDLDISRSIFPSGERLNLMIQEIVGCLKVVFRRLGHNVRVYPTTNFNCRVRSDHADITEEQDIMHMANVIFKAFYDSDYDAEKTLETLEKQGLIPGISINPLD